MSNQLNIFQEINKKVLEVNPKEEIYRNEKGEPLPWEELEYIKNGAKKEEAERQLRI